MSDMKRLIGVKGEKGPSGSPVQWSTGSGVPAEVVSYFKKKYLELKGKAKTYGELEKAITRISNEEKYVDSACGNLFHVQLMSMLHEDWNSLPIVR